MNLNETKKITTLLVGWLATNKVLQEAEVVSYGRIDLEDATWLESSTRQQWLVRQKELGLDKLLHKRFKKNIVDWHQLDSSHRKFTKYYASDCKVIELSLCYQQKIEYLTIVHLKNIEYKDYAVFFKVLHALSFEVSRVLKRGKNIPMIQNNYVDQLQKVINDRKALHCSYSLPVENQKKYMFGDVSLTALEIQYAQCLLSLMSLKEIAFKHSCSDTAVRKKIMVIKGKYGNETMSNSNLYQHFMRTGVVRFCLLGEIDLP